MASPTSLEELFDRFRQTGDPEALSEVYDRTAPRLLRNAMHVTSSAAQAEDLLQATFLATIEKRDTYDPARPLFPWLVGILSNQAKLARWRDGRAADPERLEPPRAVDPVAEAQQTEFDLAVDDAIAELPDIYQPVLVLHLRHGLQPTEIAHALRRPPGTVRAQLSRGLDRLRGALPASLAGSMAVLAAPTRGLAAIRANVLSHAAPGAATATIGTGLLGILAMKKLLLGAAAVTAGSLLWWTSTATAEDAPPLEAELPAPPPMMSIPVQKLEQPSEPRASERQVLALAPEQLQALANQSPPAAATETGANGTVVWQETGKPAAGVMVWCQDAGGHTAGRMSTRSAEDGAFAFPQLGAGSYTLGTDRGDQLASVVIADEPATDIRLVIPRGCQLTGTVVDEEGTPVANASVWLSERFVLEAGSIVATSDARGRFDISSVGTQRYVGARAEGYAPSTVHYLEAQPGESVPFELTLTRGDARLRGRAFDAAGEPVAGAAVRVSPPGKPPYVTTTDNRTARAWAPAITRSDAAGEFYLDGLSPGPLSVQVRAEGHGVFRAEIGLTAGATGDIVANLPAPSVVHGRVTTADGRPVALAMVRSGAAWDDFAMVRTATQASGEFELRDVTPGRTRMSVVVGTNTVAEQELEVAPGQRLRWDPALLLPGSIAGRVVDAAHRPLVGWNVSARSGDAHFRSVTDERGHFAMEDLAVESYELRVAYPAAARNQAYPSDVAAVIRENVQPGGVELLIEVPLDSLPTCGVRGFVLDPDGQPAGQARISVGNMEARGVVVVKVDATTGEFAVGGLVPGPYWITAKAPDHPWIRIGRKELAPGDDLNLGELVLQRGHVIEGTLQADPGVDLTAVSVEILNERNETTGVVERKGTALRTSELGAGSYRFLVRGDGIAVTQVAFEAGSALALSVEVPVRRGARRRIEATLGSGLARPEWVWLTLMQGPEMLGGRGLAEQPDGSFATDLWLAPGSYRVWVGTPQGISVPAELEVMPGAAEASPIRVVLAKD